MDLNIRVPLYQNPSKSPRILNSHNENVLFFAQSVLLSSKPWAPLFSLTCLSSHTCLCVFFFASLLWKLASSGSLLERSFSWKLYAEKGISLFVGKKKKRPHSDLWVAMWEEYIFELTKKSSKQQVSAVHPLGER
jgi:hypothetical protein